MKKAKMNSKRRKLVLWKVCTQNLLRAKKFWEVKQTQKVFFQFYCKCKELAKEKEVIKLVDASQKVTFMRNLVRAWKRYTIKNSEQRFQRLKSSNHMLQFKKHQVLKAWFNSHDVTKTVKSGISDQNLRQLTILRTKCFKAWLLKWR